MKEDEKWQPSTIRACRGYRLSDYPHGLIPVLRVRVVDRHPKALTVLEGVGLDRIEQHTVVLAGGLRAEVADLGLDLFTPPDNTSPIVSFYHGLDPETLLNALRADNVSFTFQEEGKLLRAAVALFNNRDDVARLLAVLARLV